MSASRWINAASISAVATLAPLTLSAETITGVAPALSRSPRAAAPNVDALPSPASNPPIDLESLAKSYEALIARDPASVPSGPRLFVFVSFALPQPALNRLIEQAAVAGGTLYLRGLVGGSLKETVMRVQPLLGGRRVPFEIDPRAFDRFAVAVTPAFVLVPAASEAADCANGRCGPPETFAKVAGDVSLDYALEFIQRSAPDLANTAGIFLARLKR